MPPKNLTTDQLRLLLRAGHPDGAAALADAIKAHGGDVQATAEALGMSRSTLYRVARPVLEKHGLGKVGSGIASGRVRGEKAARKRSRSA